MTKCFFAAHGAERVAGRFDVDRSLLCDRWSEVPNVVFVDREIVDALARPLQPREEDWLDLLRTVYVADLLCARAKNEGVTRDIEISLAVREHSRVAGYLPLVRQLFHRMAHDNLRLNIEQAEQIPPARYPKSARKERFDALSLLSGGLDSARGALVTLGESSNPCFVSCKSASHIKRAQDEVRAALERVAQRKIHSVEFRVDIRHRHPNEPLPASDSSQRSRTLLYAGAAALIAAEHGIRQIAIPENGIMAINCPLTAGRRGPFSTHTAHPTVLSMMSSLFSSVLDKDIEVVNPIVSETKTEVVKNLMKGGMSELIPLTHSCWIARRNVHCGTCVPCIVRRFAVLSAGSLDGRYDHDILREIPDPRAERFKALGEYLLFAQRFVRMSDDDLIFEFSEFNFEGPEHDRVIAAYRRWMADVRMVISSSPNLAGVM